MLELSPTLSKWLRLPFPLEEGRGGKGRGGKGFKEDGLYLLTLGLDLQWCAGC